jgi:hypothetical protein
MGLRVLYITPVLRFGSSYNSFKPQLRVVPSLLMILVATRFAHEPRHHHHLTLSSTRRCTKGSRCSKAGGLHSYGAFPITLGFASRLKSHDNLGRRMGEAPGAGAESHPSNEWRIGEWISACNCDSTTLFMVSNSTISASSLWALTTTRVSRAP